MDLSLLHFLILPLNYSSSVGISNTLSNKNNNNNEIYIFYSGSVSLQLYATYYQWLIL